MERWLKWKRKQKQVAWILPFCVAIATIGPACSEDNSGPMDVLVIKMNPGHCQYTIAPARLDTLESLAEMRGKVGKVVFSKTHLNPKPKDEEILEFMGSLDAIDSQFANADGVYAPLDETSLFAVSLYYSVELGQKLFARLDSEADMLTLLPNSSNTFIVHNVRRGLKDAEPEEDSSDNAEFFGRSVQGENGGTVTGDFLFSYPTSKITQLPLGLNTGVMVHEFTHLMFHHLFYEKAFALDVGAGNGNMPINTLRAIDEGNADYFGFLATMDPGFFHCSFPGTHRDMTTEKFYDADLKSRMTDDPDADPHLGGALWAAIQYKIGEAVGFEENGRYLVGMMKNLIQCAISNNALNLDFSVAARCHAQAAGSASGSVNSVYSKYLGGQ